MKTNFIYGCYLLSLVCLACSNDSSNDSLNCRLNHPETIQFHSDSQEVIVENHLVQKIRNSVHKKLMTKLLYEKIDSIFIVENPYAVDIEIYDTCLSWNSIKTGINANIYLSSYKNESYLQNFTISRPLQIQYIDVGMTKREFATKMITYFNYNNSNVVDIYDKEDDSGSHLIIHFQGDSIKSLSFYTQEIFNPNFDTERIVKRYSY